MLQVEQYFCSNIYEKCVIATYSTSQDITLGYLGTYPGSVNIVKTKHEHDKIWRKTPIKRTYTCFLIEKYIWGQNTKIAPIFIIKSKINPAEGQFPVINLPLQ